MSGHGSGRTGAASQAQSSLGVRASLLSSFHTVYVRKPDKPPAVTKPLTRGDQLELLAQEAKWWAKQGLAADAISRKLGRPKAWVCKVLDGRVYKDSPAWKP